MELFKIYRNNNVIHEFKADVTHSDGLGEDSYCSFNVSSKNELDIRIGDYNIIDGVIFEISDPIDMEENDGVYTYPLKFMWPGYKLKRSIITDEGATSFSYHGGVGDLMTLLINSLKKDNPEFALGTIEENGIIDLAFDNSNCMQALKDICEASEMEWQIENTTINVKRRIGKDTDYLFKYGKSGGGYSVKLSRVANTSIITRMIGKGGTINLPKDYVSPDSPRRLNLGDEILERNVDKYGRITGVYINENIYPRLINKTVQSVEVPADPKTAASWKIKLDVPFDLSQYYANDEIPLVKFQTGDLTGSEFEIVENSWNNADKTLSIVTQEEEDGYRLPNEDRQPRVGDVFVLLNIYMPQTYVDEATQELRKATQDDLDRKCEPQYAPSLIASSRYLRKNGIVLSIGDGITIKIGSHSITTRIIGISQSSSDDEISFELGDQMLYSYDTKTSNTIEQIQATLKQLISIADIKRLFQNLINAWYPKWFDQKLHRNADVEFNSVNSTKGVRAEEVSSHGFTSGPLGTGFRLDRNGNAEFQNITVRGRFEVIEMLIQQVSAVGGQMLVSPASVKITGVEELASGYKCLFETDGGTVPNPFVVNDQAFHQVFSGSTMNRYWRLVTEVGAGYLVLSKADCEEGSGVPAADDEIMLLGNRTDTSRQSAILISSYGSYAPYIGYYSGINSYSLAGKEPMRSGNLEGIVSPAFGNLTGFGLYAENAFITGVFKLISGKTVEEAITDNVQEGIAGIQIGGTNLLNQGVFVDNGAFYVAYNISSLEIGKQYIVHGNTGFEAIRFNGTGSYIYSNVFTVPDDYAFVDIYFRKDIPLAELRVKLEEGNKPTSWSPSLHDQQGQIDEAKSMASAAQQGVSRISEEVTNLSVETGNIKLSVSATQQRVDNIRPGSVNYLNGSRLDNTNGWMYYDSIQVVDDEKFGKVVEVSCSLGYNYQKEFDLPREELGNTELVYYVIAKNLSDGQFLFGGWPNTVDSLNSNTSNKTDLGNGWYQYWSAFHSTEDIGSTFGLNSMTGTWRFYAAGVLKGNTPASWSPSLPDQQADMEKQAEQKALGQSWSSGKMLYTDPTFREGTNGISVYNNSNNGAVTMERIPRLADSPIEDSGYNLAITTTAAAEPELGGFYFSTPTRPNALLITRIIAKIPAGYTIQWASNDYGQGYNSDIFWTTPRIGTGHWQEYIVVVKCGSAGNFHTTNFFHLKWGQTPVTWYVAYASVFDVTSTESVASQKAEAAKNEAISTAAQDAQAKAESARQQAVSQAAVYTDAKTTTTTRIDLTADTYNRDKYYPVTMNLPMTPATEITVRTDLGYLGVNNRPPWSTHEYGYSVLCSWSSNGNAWGSIDIYRIIKSFTCGWVNGISPVGSIGQLNHSSHEYIYVRGGGIYDFVTTNSVVPILRSDGLSILDQSIGILDLSDIVPPTPDLAVLRTDIDQTMSRISLIATEDQFSSLNPNDPTLTMFGRIDITAQRVALQQETINSIDGTLKTAGIVLADGTVSLVATRDNLISTINLSGEAATIRADKISLDGAVVIGSDGAQVSINNGVLTAINAVIQGTITAMQGKIGGFDIKETYLENGGLKLSTGSIDYTMTFTESHFGAVYRLPNGAYTSLYIKNDIPGNNRCCAFFQRGDQNIIIGLDSYMLKTNGAVSLGDLYKDSYFHGNILMPSMTAQPGGDIGRRTRHVSIDPVTGRLYYIN